MSRFSPFKFLHICDHHFGTPRSFRFRPDINQRWAAIKHQMYEVDADLLLVGGDLTRDGDTHEGEYQIAREDLETLPFPFFVIPGNADVGNKVTDKNGPDNNKKDTQLNMKSARLNLFSSYFGPNNWTFLHKEVRFSGFFAAVAGSGLPEEKSFWRFMERLPNLPAARHHVAMMHYWLYIDSLNEPNWDITKVDQYLPWYFGIDEPYRGRIFYYLEESGVDVLFCGHVHTGRPVETINGMRIYKAPSAGNFPQLTDRWDNIETRSGFNLCHVSHNQIDVEFIVGVDQCGEFDSYGPVGHVKLEDRDYSQAREAPPLSPDPWLLDKNKE